MTQDISNRNKKCRKEKHFFSALNRNNVKQLWINLHPGFIKNRKEVDATMEGNEEDNLCIQISIVEGCMKRKKSKKGKVLKDKDGRFKWETIEDKSQRLFILKRKIAWQWKDQIRLFRTKANGKGLDNLNRSRPDSSKK